MSAVPTALSGCGGAGTSTRASAGTPEARASAAARDATPDAVCAAIAAKARGIEDRVQAALNALPEGAAVPGWLTSADVALPGCVGDATRAKGTWAIALDEAGINAESATGETEDGVVLDANARIVWIAANGSERSVARPFSTGFHFERLAFVQAHDFDRDGQSELVVSVTSGQPDHATHWYEFFRVTASGVVTLWSEHRPPITGLEDIDGDGVLDLLHDSTFEATQGMNTWAAFPGVTHLATDGRLESADAAARAYYLRKCPTRVAVADIKPGEPEATLEKATCAWLWGAQNRAIKAQVHAALRAPGTPEDEVMEITGPWAEPTAKPPLLLM